MRPQAPKALTHLTKEQCKALQGLGIVDARKVEVSITAHRQLRLTRSLLAAARVFIKWIVNFKKHKYSRNRNEGRDKCINGAAFAVLPITGRLHAQLRGHPTHVTLVANSDVLGSQLKDAARRVQNNVLTLVQSNLQFEHVCAPLDIRRYGVSMAPWHISDMTGDNVSSHDGPLRSWKGAINELKWHTQACQTSDMTLPTL